MPPACCDAHHLVRTADGGLTTLDDLVLLCRRDHVLWHKGKLTLRDLRIPWRTARPPDGEPDPPPDGVLRGWTSQDAVSRPEQDGARDELRTAAP